jgi:tetratricopeptide (TPR) repeat protein
MSIPRQRLLDFIQQRLFAVNKEAGPAPGNSADCLTADKIAPISIAAHAGVQAGDLLVEVDGQPASDFDFESLLDPNSQHRYRFYQPAHKQWLQLTSVGAPLGIELSESTQTLVERSTADDFDYSDLVTLWERGEWQALEQSARAALKPRLLLRIVAFCTRHSFRETPSLLMLGAALVEQGRQAEGMAMIREYHENYEDRFTTDCQGIARFYLGQNAQANNDPESAARFFEEACDCWSNERFAKALQDLTGQEPSSEEPGLAGTPFPCKYELPREEDGKIISLAQSLQSMQEHQLRFICLMASSRTNGPYDEFMKQYARLSRHFADFLAELHVITENHITLARRDKERREFVDQWRTAESQARELGIPFAVLYDEHGLVTQAVDTPGVPYVLLIDHQGTIVGEDTYSDMQVWNTLASVCKAQ